MLICLYRVDELSEEVLTIFPGKGERAYVSDADPSHNGANGRKMGWLEPAICQN